MLKRRLSDFGPLLNTMFPKMILNPLCLVEWQHMFILVFDLWPSTSHLFQYLTINDSTHFMEMTTAPVNSDILLVKGSYTSVKVRVRKHCKDLKTDSQEMTCITCAEAKRWPGGHGHWILCPSHWISEIGGPIGHWAFFSQATETKNNLV